MSQGSQSQEILPLVTGCFYCINMCMKQETLMLQAKHKQAVKLMDFNLQLQVTIQVLNMTYYASQWLCYNTSLKEWSIKSQMQDFQIESLPEEPALLLGKSNLVCLTKKFSLFQQNMVIVKELNRNNHKYYELKRKEPY